MPAQKPRPEPPTSKSRPSGGEAGNVALATKITLLFLSSLSIDALLITGVRKSTSANNGSGVLPSVK